MESCNRPTLSITAFCECTPAKTAIWQSVRRSADFRRRQADPLGARAGLVSQLTGMEKTANRLTAGCMENYPHRV